MVKQLKIQKLNGSWLTLPQCQYEVAPKSESQLKQMRSGKLREEYLGERINISGTISYIKPSDQAELMEIVRAGGFTQVKYLDLDSEEKTGYFKISPIKATLFGQDTYGNDVWKDVPISMQAQEVV